MNDLNEFTPAIGSHDSRPSGRPERSEAAGGSRDSCPRCHGYLSLTLLVNGVPVTNVCPCEQGASRGNDQALASEGLPAAPCSLPNNHETSTTDK